MIVFINGICDEYLKIIQGELHDIETIKKAIEDSDAVVSLFGTSTGKVKNNSISEGVKNIIKAMDENGIKRIIQISTSAAKDLNDKFDLYFDFMCTMVKIAIPKLYEDIQIINQAIRNSDLAWFIVEQVEGKKYIGKAPFISN